MPFQPAGNAAEVTVRALINGEVCINTLNFLGTVGWGAVDLSELTTAVRDAWQTNMLPILPGNYLGISCVGRGLRTETDFEETLSFGAVAAGTLPETGLSNNVSIAIQFKTGLIGRSNRGRNFWPLLTEESVTNNTVSTARINSILAAYNALRTATNEFGIFQLSVLSRQQDGVLLPSAVTTPVTAFAVANNVVDSMRRRLPGRGV